MFLTGASGHIASAVIPELVVAGHDVTGLARSDRSADIVRSLGAAVHEATWTISTVSARPPGRLTASSTSVSSTTSSTPAT